MQLHSCKLRPASHSDSDTSNTTIVPHDTGDDDITVVTNNCSHCSNDADSWTTVPSQWSDDSDWTLVSNGKGTNRTAHALQALTPPIPTANPYDVLSFDDNSIAIDSGASDGFGDEDTPGTNRQPTKYGITMASATGDCKVSIATDAFDLPLPPAALDFHVFKRGDIQRPLLSVGKACDTGCDVHFYKTHCNFNKNGTTLLTGYRDRHSGLYLLPSSPSTKDDSNLGVSPRTQCLQTSVRDDFSIRYTENHTLQSNPTGKREKKQNSKTGTHESNFQANRPITSQYPTASTNQIVVKHQSPKYLENTKEKSSHNHTGLNAYALQTIPQLMRYLHGCAGFPTTTTWCQAINRGYYMGWPGLDASRVKQYLPKSEETTMGHQKLIRQGIRSTTSKGEQVGRRRTSKTTGRQRHVTVCSVPLKDLKGIIGTDQTGRFPVDSDRGHKYIFVLSDTDTDFIYAVPIKSRKKAELIRAFEEAYTTIVRCGFEPVLHRTDHETSTDLTSAIAEKGLDYEIVPPSNHRRNPAERAIQTFKAHFIAVLNGIDRDFPEGGWDLLLPQVNMTLNMLRPCGINPAHSAYAYMYGAFDFNAHPLAPLGCRAIVHERSIGNGGRRAGWGNKGKIGYYIGPAMDSYRVWRFYVPETNGIQETDTAEFFPRYPLPTISPASQIAEQLDAIKVVLEQPVPAHSDVTEDAKLRAVIDRLRGMYTNNNQTYSPALTHPTEHAEPPRVPYHEGINRYRPRKKQRFPLGTRIKVKEGRKTFIGTAVEYSPHTGLYYVEFEDGEYEEFNHDEMMHFQLVKPYSPRAPTTAANQVVVRGYFPKAGPRPRVQFNPLQNLGTLHGLVAGSIYDEELHKWMAYKDLIKHPNPKIRKRWELAGNNEFARLAQGLGEVDGLNVVTFIARRDVPVGKQATYARYVVDYRPEKDEPWRLRITCGGDRLEYFGDTTTHSASMETIKCQLNSIVSTLNAKAATGDISNMYLGSTLPEAEYVRFRLELIPEEFVKAYALTDLATPDGYVYARVNKAWYGLKQAGKIAHDDLVTRLAEAGYHKSGHVEGYFKHETRAIDFTLVVDDFLIKYTKDEDLDHLRNAVGKYYKFKVDPDAKQYVGINLKWNYITRTVRLSMDGYVEQALLELEHVRPSKAHHAPSRYDLPKYGARVQYVKVDETAPLSTTRIRFIQRAVGKLLYYARAVDPTMLHAINDISLSAAKGTEATLDATMYLLNYAHTYPNAEIIYRQSDMILRVDSDAAYLVAPEARSRAGGYQYLSNKEGTLFNGPVLVIAKVIKNVMASATEAELGALYMNAQEAVGLRNCLEAMGFPQPATPLKTDNNTANGILNNTMKQKRSKAIDVRFYWLRDRAQQGQFYIFWESGKNNLADYFTKHHPPTYHKAMRPIQTFIEGLSPESLQGCIKIMRDNQAGSGVKASPIPKTPTVASLNDVHTSVAASDSALRTVMYS